MIIAQDPQEALQLSMESGHFLRPSNYRKFLDCTDEYLANKEMPGLQAALDAGRSGVAQLIDGVWHIGGKPAAD